MRMSEYYYRHNSIGFRLYIKIISISLLDCVLLTCVWKDGQGYRLVLQTISKMPQSRGQRMRSKTGGGGGVGSTKLPIKKGVDVYREEARRSDKSQSQHHCQQPQQPQQPQHTQHFIPQTAHQRSLARRRGLSLFFKIYLKLIYITTLASARHLVRLFPPLHNPGPHFQRIVELRLSLRIYLVIVRC